MDIYRRSRLSEQELEALEMREREVGIIKSINTKTLPSKHKNHTNFATVHRFEK